MSVFVSPWCCASSCLSSLLWLSWERCQWVPSPVLTGSYLSFMLSWSVLTLSIIICTAGAGQLLAGTPKGVVCFQICLDGQNLASPERAAWAENHVHPLLFYSIGTVWGVVFISNYPRAGSLSYRPYLLTGPGWWKVGQCHVSLAPYKVHDLS